MNTISILGCGWLGLPLAEKLLQEGFVVNGSTTTIEKIESLKIKGVNPFLIDIHNIEKSIVDFLDSETLIICITGKKQNSFKALINIIEDSKVQNVLFISSTSVYKSDNAIATEKTVTLDSPLRNIEQLFEKSKSFKTTILRFGGLFGYNRKPGNFFPKSGLPMNNPEGYVNLIHQDDCITSILAIVKQNSWGEVYNACANSHPTRRAFYSKEKAKLNNAIPKFNETATNQYKIINSDKLKKNLSIEFRYEDLMKL